MIQNMLFTLNRFTNGVPVREAMYALALGAKKSTATVKEEKCSIK